MIHTREGHVPDLSDCPPAKLNRGEPSLRIGAPGPKGRILIRGEYGHDIIDDLAPAARRAGDRQAGQGLVPRHVVRRAPAGARHHQPGGDGRDHRGLRAHHRPRGQRPRLRVPRAVGLRRLLLPRVPARRPADDRRTGRDLRVGRAVVGVPPACPWQCCPIQVSPLRRFRHDHNDGAGGAQAPLVGRRRHQRLLRPRLQHPGQRARAVGPVPGRGAHPGRRGVRRDPPGAGRRSC